MTDLQTPVAAEPGAVATVLHERHLDVGPFRTRYLEGGAPGGPVVLLLHDGTWGGASSVTWGVCGPHLAAAGYRVIAPDLLGYGGTDKAVFVDRSQYAGRLLHLKNFLVALGIEQPIHLVGSSFGGSAVLRALAADNLFPIRSGVSIAGTGGPWKTSLQTAELSHWDGTGIDLERIAAHLMDPAHPGFDHHVAERLRWGADAGHYRAIRAVKMEVPAAFDNTPKPGADWLDRLAVIDVPLLLVAGSGDRLLEPEWISELHSRVPASTTTVVEGRHSPNLDHPQELAHVLSEFLAAN